MAPMPAVRTTAELYPPGRDRALWDLLLAVATPEVDRERRTFVLKRALVRSEREMLSTRLRELEKWTVPARPRAVTDEVTLMLVGWSASLKATTEEEAAGIAAKYAVDLGGLPAWAVARACQRFATAGVQPEEVGSKKPIDWSYPPSAAMVRAVAVEILRPFGEEATRIRMTLQGEPRRADLDPEARAAAAAKMLAVAGKFSGRVRKVDDAEKERRRKRDERAEALARRSVLNEYRDLGLAPPEERPGKALASPSMLMKLGWRIEEVSGERVLVAPAPAPPPTPTWDRMNPPPAERKEWK